MASTKRRARVAVGAAVVTFVATAGWVGGHVLGVGPLAPGPSRQAAEALADGTGGDAQPGADAASTGRAFLAAWQAGRYADMQELVADQADDMERVYRGLRTRLKLRRLTVTPGTLDAAGTSLPFHAVLALPGHDYAYDGAVPLRETSKGWRVAFTSATVHPKLRNGQTLKVVSEPAEARFVDRAGRELTRDEDLVQNLLGVDAERGLRRLGVAAAGSGPSTLAVVDAGTGATLTELATWPGSTKGGTRTTLDLTVQAAAEKALASTRGRAGLVALDVSTGEVRALANSPVSGDPASLEPNAPGSTFKIITAAAALEQGLTPTSSVDCPGSVVIGGRTIRNHEEARPGSVTLTTAFAQSCNTAFAALGARLPQGALERTAARFGFGVDQLLPIASPGGSLPAPDSTARLVEDSIGQGQVTASPLAMASVAAGVAAGTWHQPHVLPCPRCASHDVPHAADLRTLMRAVVTSGTGTKADLPGRPVYGKTGTAEYGTGAQLPTHAWFVGWRGGIAFAVYVEDGVSGGSVAAPVAARFLRSLPAGL